jgi:endonuclease/exonuclease/phosphatase family metal-dependent hydrolase
MGKLMMVLGLFRLFGYATDPLLDSHEVHAVTGEQSRVGASRPVDLDRLKVVSWNIAQGTKYERVRETLAALDADIYLLQEVDMGVRRSDYRAVARDLAHDLDLNWVFAGEFQEIGQARGTQAAITGQAVLSRYPIDSASTLRFETQANWRWKLDPLQPRRGGRVALRAESAGVLIYNAHIESAKDDDFRHRQIDEVLVDDGHTKDRPVIFAGDFNTDRLPHESPIVQCLLDEGFVDALGVDAATRRTSINHGQPLDWIFVRNLSADSGRVIPVRRASDHFPLEAEITFSPLASSGQAVASAASPTLSHFLQRQ